MRALPCVQMEWSALNAKDPQVSGYIKRAIAPPTRRWAEAYASVTYATLRAAATTASIRPSGEGVRSSPIVVKKPAIC